MTQEKSRSRRPWRTIGIVAAVLVVLVGGAILYLSNCSNVPAPDLNYPENVSREEQIQYVMQQHIHHTGCTPVHNFVLYVENEPENIVVYEGAGIVGRNDMPMEPDYQFRIASVTKTFVATIILQLMEEGKLNLDDRIDQYVAGIDYVRFEELHVLDGVSHSHEITVDELLQHRTGLSDIFVDTAFRFDSSVLLHPHRIYTVERVFDTYFDYGLNEKPHFVPGEGYYYADTNYMLLGLIIEQITGKSLPDQIRQRILVPLGMDNTYFEFYEPEVGNGKRLDSYLAFINIDNGIYTSHEWAGGGLVSTTEDLSKFIQALFAVELLDNESTLQLMLDNSENALQDATYARGINHYVIDGVTFYGHGGYYGSLMLYEPVRKLTFIAHMGQVALPYSREQIENLVLTSLEIVGAE